MKKRIVCLLLAAVMCFSILSVGVLAAGGSWQSSSGRWWYRNADGSYPANCWQRIGGKWYHFDGSGYMQAGWQKIGRTWYYLGSDGAMRTGWQKVGKIWYYFQSSGAMATGWVKSGSSWYYMKSSGAMATGWQKIGKVWYYFQSSGAMQTGWLKQGSDWYYLGSDGAMQTGWVDVNGVSYYLRNDGTYDSSRTKSSGGTNTGGVYVTDAISYAFTNGMGESVAWHVPRIEPADSRFTKINSEMYNLYGVGSDYANRSSNSYPGNGDVSYTWGLNGNILSICIEYNAYDYYYTTFAVYNVDISSGARLSKKDVLAYAGYSDSDFRALVKTRLAESYDQMYSANLEQFKNDSYWMGQYTQNRNKTLSSDNVSSVCDTVFLDNQGRLCVIANRYAIAGAEHAYSVLVL